MPTVRVTILGSGTSMGVPTLGCDCAVCISTDPRNKRFRSSILIEQAGRNILVDCGPDFRTQALAVGLRDVDAVLLTHTHTDHIAGIDDLRPYNFLRGHSIPIYGSASHLGDLRCRYAYAFGPPQPGGGIPDLALETVESGVPFKVAAPGLENWPILPLTVLHGKQPILGFRFGEFAYLTDVSAVPPETIEALKGVRWLITSALRHRPHPTHMSVAEAVDFVRQVAPERAWFTHICHDLDHEQTNADLPQGMALLYDGQVIETE
jgi:phosphoribosyl 1,2-cyclic phosphate phosphodiesterase